MATREIVSFTPIDQDGDSEILAFEITKSKIGSMLYQLHSVKINGEVRGTEIYTNLPEALAGMACKMAAQPNIKYEVEK